jgi:hypothetical protein
LAAIARPIDSVSGFCFDVDLALFAAWSGDQMHELPFQLSRRAILLSPVFLLMPEKAMARRRSGGGGRSWRSWRSVEYSHAGAAIAGPMILAIGICGVLLNGNRRSGGAGKPVSQTKSMRYRNRRWVISTSQDAEVVAREPPQPPRASSRLNLPLMLIFITVCTVGAVLNFLFPP